MPTVLYLEDTTDQRDLVVMVLQTINIQVEVAADGEEGLKKLEEHRPDLILLDLGMPKLDGLGFMKIIKEKPDTSKIPIVVISAWTASKYREQAKQAGADDFVSKPYDIDNLIEVVQKHLISPAG